MNLQDLPLDVVKKWEFDYKPYGQQESTHVETIGIVVCNHWQKSYQLIDKAGDVYNCAAMANITYKISRSDPEAAKLLREAATCFNDWVNCCKQIDELTNLKYKKQQDYRGCLQVLENHDAKQKAGIATSDVKKVAEAFVEKLNELPKYFGRSVEDEYYELTRVTYNSDTGATTVVFDMLLHIRKYVTANTYSFIEEEYDQTLYVHNCPALEKFLSGYSQSYMTKLAAGFANAPFKFKLDKLTAGIGDKNWLVVSQDMTIVLDTPAAYSGFISFVQHFK